MSNLSFKITIINGIICQNHIFCFPRNYHVECIGWTPLWECLNLSSWFSCHLFGKILTTAIVSIFSCMNAHSMPVYHNLIHTKQDISLVMLIALLVLNIYWWIIQLKTVTAAMNLCKCFINWEFHFYFCRCDQNTMRKSKLGKKRFISTYCLWLETIIVRSQDRDVKQLVTLHLKSRAEKNEQMHAQSFAFLFACAQSYFSIFAHFRSTCLGE